MEPDALVQCPYDRNHRVRVSRLPYHLVRCEQNNPRASRHLATCPFNARHRVPRDHLRSHLSSCPDKLLLDPLQDTEGMPWSTLGTSLEPPEPWQPPPCRENWDAELDALEELPPFILNATSWDLPTPCDRSVPAAPPSRGRARGAARPPKGLSQRGPSTVTVGAESCPAHPKDAGRRGGREGLQGVWRDRRAGDCAPSF